MRQFLFFLAQYAHLWHTSQRAGGSFRAQRYRAGTMRSTNVTKLRLTVNTKPSTKQTQTH